MKTRKLFSGIDEQGKEILGSSLQEDAVNNKTVSPPIVRKLRSRVITSDTEDDGHVKSKTSKSQRKAIKENTKSSPSDDIEITKAKLSRTVGLALRTPKPNKRLSAVNLFKIVEEKEEVNVEESKEEKRTKSEFNEILSNTNANTCNDNVLVQESAMPIDVVVKEDPGGNEDISEQESLSSAIKEEATETFGTQKEEKKNYFSEDEPLESGGDSDSDDDIPETVSFSSSKNTINMELSVISEAIRREKEKRKDRMRRKIEMIRTQKAEKEKKRKEKMELFKISVPERLAEDVASSLPDRPDIPTVKKSASIGSKRKNEEKDELEHRDEDKKNKITKFDDYIPITGIAGSTQFGVVPLEVASHLPKPSSRSAAEFKKKALFGSRIQREPSKNLLVYRQKLSAAGKLQKGYPSSSLLQLW